jgi:lipoteichoic acid synthase
MHRGLPPELRIGGGFSLASGPGDRGQTGRWSQRLEAAFREGIVFGLPLHAVVNVTFAVITYMAFLLKLRITRGHVVWDWMPTTTILQESAFVVALMAGLALLFPRRHHLAWMAGYVIVSFMLLVATMYAGYAGGILSVRDLVLADQLPEVWSSVSNLLRVHWVEYVFEMPLILAVGLFLNRYAGPAVDQRRTRMAWSAFVGSALICGFLIAGALALPPGVDDIAAARERGLVAWQIATNFRPAAAAFTEEIPEDPRDLQALIDEIIARELGERVADFEPGIAEAKSVIVVQVEALQTFPLGLEVDGTQITPNLIRLADTSWYFPNTYSQVRKGTTADAEFTVNTSLYAPYAAAAPVAYSGRKLSSLPWLLRDAGYQTAVFHTNFAGFWNRVRMMPNLGFEDFYDRTYFGEEDVIGFGASDEVLYDRTLNALLELDEAGRPFYAYVISATSHHPFDPLPASKEPVQLPSPYDGTLVGRYLSHIEYADRALGMFLEEYERSGLADRCVLVVVGDHFGLAPRQLQDSDMRALQQALGRSYDVVDAMRVPLFVRLPGQTEGHRIEQTVGHVDIMPTLADVLGIDLTGVPHFGTSAFMQHTTLMQGCGLVTPGAYLTESVAVVPGVNLEGSTLIDLASHRELELSAVAEDSLDRIRRLSGLSDAYVRSLPTDGEALVGEKAYIPN